MWSIRKGPKQDLQRIEVEMFRVKRLTVVVCQEKGA